MPAIETRTDIDDNDDGTIDQIEFDDDVDGTYKTRYSVELTACHSIRPLLGEDINHAHHRREPD